MLSKKRISTTLFVFLVLFFGIWKTHAQIRNLQDNSYEEGGTAVYVKVLTAIHLPATSIDEVTIESRKNLRWPLQWVLGSIYQAVGIAIAPINPSQSLIIYLDHAVHAACLSLGFLFIVLSAEIIYGTNSRLENNVWLWCVTGYFYALLVGGWAESYSAKELLVIAGVLYAALKRKLFLFLVMGLIAVANRETGVIVGVIYAMFNWKGARSLYAIAYPPVVFGLLNAQLLMDTDLYSASLITTVGSEQSSMFDFLNYSISEWAAFWTYTLLFYLPLVGNKLVDFENPAFRKLSLCLGMYVSILAIGTYLGNIYPHIITLPFLVLLIVFNYRQPPLSNNF